jgi:5-methylcytosine-specific restriction endonuclease McrA
MDTRRQRFNEERRLQRALYRLEHPLPVRSVNKVKKNCIYCGKEFSVFPSLVRVECCSRTCAKQLQGAQAKGKLLKPLIRPCPKCGTIDKIINSRCPQCIRERGLAEYHRRMQDPHWRKRIRKYATDESRRVQNDPARRRIRNLRNAESEARRRAQQLATKTARISYERIVSFHGMICSICGEGITEQKGELSFDHVIPLIRGGTHTEDNLRPAHTVCNRRKNRRLPSEVNLQWLSKT